MDYIRKTIGKDPASSKTFSITIFCVIPKHKTSAEHLMIINHCRWAQIVLSVHTSDWIDTTNNSRCFAPSRDLTKDSATRELCEPRFWRTEWQSDMQTERRPKVNCVVRRDGVLRWSRTTNLKWFRKIRRPAGVRASTENREDPKFTP